VTADDVWVVIPSRGDYPDLLAGIVANCGRPERIVLVWTGEGPAMRLGTLVRRHHGPTNIHGWWNHGIDLAAGFGARYVAVLNDDLELTPGCLPKMADVLRGTGRTLAVVGDGNGMTGWAWMLDVTHGLRPDESFRWWFGDNDLWLRARQHYQGTVGVDVPIRHVHPNEATSASKELQALAEADRQLFDRRHLGALA
jgi:hypothetical protein